MSKLDLSCRATQLALVEQLDNKGLSSCWTIPPLSSINVLELAGNAARDNNKTRIVLRHIQLVVRNYEELSKLLKDVTITNGGVMPNIHNLLLPKKTGGRRTCPSKYVAFTIDLD
ncbi:Histone H2A [Forsythia ovata]|uniref:Histone H2A n=1 Tax=Forsythia ovata TaxID=205694 RepID=A0ABD1U5Z8_9LAMI